jgi:hypothetical protein
MTKARTPSQRVTNDFALLRLLVGFLGQKRHGRWWDCDFLDPVGIRFLEVTFPRTARKAALRSTNDAAARVHDQALGRIGSYHLFRLPPQAEVVLEGVIESFDWDKSAPAIGSRDAALAELQRLAGTLIKAPEGPVRIGIEDRIFTPSSVSEIAAHYHSAFQQGIQSFPYFAAKANGR